MSDLNVCWNNLYRKLFHLHRRESVRVFTIGIGLLVSLILCIFLNWSLLSFKHLSISSNVVLCHVLYCYTVYCDRFLQLFHELNLQFGCSIATMQEDVFSHFNFLCDCV